MPRALLRCACAVLVLAALTSACARNPRVEGAVMPRDPDYEDLASCVLGVALQEGFLASAEAGRPRWIVAERAQNDDVRSAVNYAYVTFRPRAAGDSVWAEAHVSGIGPGLRWNWAIDPSSVRVLARTPRECRIARRSSGDEQRGAATRSN